MKFGLMIKKQPLSGKKLLEKKIIYKKEEYRGRTTQLEVISRTREVIRKEIAYQVKLAKDGKK